MDKMETDPRESTVILDYILRRIRKGLGLNAIIIGPPGIGKSYVCMRLGELVHNALFNERFDVKTHVVYDLPSAFRFARNVTRKGEVLVIEEVSVMASSRRSMSNQNIGLNMILDTVRKKQIILIMNAPLIKAVDRHIQRMSHMLVECLRINRREKLATVKAFTLTSSQDTGKVYKHRFKNGGREVHRSYFSKPSAEICNDYEVVKSKFMNDLYELMEEKAEAKSGKKKENTLIIDSRTKPTDKMIRRYALFKQLGSVQKVADKEGVTDKAIYDSIQAFEKKAKIRIIEVNSEHNEFEKQAAKPLV